MERALVPVPKKLTFKMALSEWPVYHLVQNPLELYNVTECEGNKKLHRGSCVAILL